MAVSNTFIIFLLSLIILLFVSMGLYSIRKIMFPFYIWLVLALIFVIIWIYQWFIILKNINLFVIDNKLKIGNFDKINKESLYYSINNEMPMRLDIYIDKDGFIDINSIKNKYNNQVKTLIIRNYSNSGLLPFCYIDEEIDMKKFQ